MGKKSNGRLRRERLLERALRKGVDLSAPAQTDGYAYVYGQNGTYLTARKG